MRSIDIEGVTTVLNELAKQIPSEGGHLRIGETHLRDGVTFNGDHIAFMRLRMALLRYGVETQHLGNTGQQDNFRALEGFFPEPSWIRLIRLVHSGVAPPGAQRAG